MRHLHLCTLVFLVVLPASFSARQNPQETFRSGVNLVQVDVVVVDRAGAPVRGLTAEDFEVRENGRPVGIQTFTAVDHGTAALRASLPGASLSGGARVTNEQADGRLFVLVLDDLNLSFGAGGFYRSKRIARQFVERLAADDQVAIVTSSNRLASRTEFTSDKQRLLRTIDGLRPEGDVGEMGGIKARFSMARLADVASALGRVQDRRKAFVFISEGVPIDLESILSRNPETSTEAEALLAGALALVRAAMESNVAIYTFDPGAVQGPTLRHDYLRVLASNTGGLATVNTTEPVAGLDRMLAESSAYYLLGYHSDVPPDGRFHRIDVKVRQPGFEVRARAGHLAPNARRPPAGEAENPVDRLLASPVHAAGLPLRLVAVPVPSEARDGASILLLVEVPGASLRGSSSLELVALAFDADGRVRGQDRFSGALPDGEPTSAPRWIRMASRLEVPPGRTHVRVAVRGSAGTDGSVFAELDVPDFNRDELAVGGLVLGTLDARGVARRVHLEEIAAPLAPIATSDLSPGLQVSAGLPVRVASRHAKGQVTIRTFLVTPEGVEREIDSVVRSARDLSGKRGGWHVLPLDLQTLTPGAYVLRTIVTLDRRAVARELPFSVAGGS